MIDEKVFAPVIKELVQYYYKNLGNLTGGYCHIALDDGNLEDGNLWFCQEECKRHNDNIGYLIMTCLRSFSVKEREGMYDEWWGMRSTNNLADAVCHVCGVKRGRDAKHLSFCSVVG